MTTLASKKKPAARSLRHQQATIVKTVGQRMKAARELCNLSLSEAARLLGYANPSKLSKVENFTDTNSVPVWLIPAAAKLYDVSTDYLYGIADDWETGLRATTERGTSQWLFETWDTMRRRDMEVLKRLHDRIEGVGDVVAAFVSAGREVHEAVQRFGEIHPQFSEDMRGSARLVAAAERALVAATSGDAKLKRFRMECQVASHDSNQLSLALTSGMNAENQLKGD